MYILHQPCSIFEDAKKALTGAIQHINVDKVFIDPVYQRQVHNLPQLWSKVDDLIDREKFCLAFASQCNRLELPFTEYDLDSALEKAQT